MDQKIDLEEGERRDKSSSPENLIIKSSRPHPNIDLQRREIEEGSIPSNIQELKKLPQEQPQSSLQQDISKPDSEIGAPNFESENPSKPKNSNSEK